MAPLTINLVPLGGSRYIYFIIHIHIFFLDSRRCNIWHVVDWQMILTPRCCIHDHGKIHLSCQAVKHEDESKSNQVKASKWVPLKHLAVFTTYIPLIYIANWLIIMLPTTNGIYVSMYATPLSLLTNGIYVSNRSPICICTLDDPKACIWWSGHLTLVS